MIHRALEHRARAVVALLLVAIAGLTLAACGSDDNGGGGGSGDTADARTLLRETFSGTKDVRSGRVALSVRLAETGGEQISVGLAGPFENQGGDAYPKFDIALDARLGAQGSFSAGLVSTSDRLFVELEGSAYEIPAQFLDTAREQNGGRRFSIPDLDPQSWIDNPEVVGQEQVGGAETEHISGDVNVSALLDSIDRVLAEFDRQGLSDATAGQLPTSIPADTRAEIERTVKDPRVDVWTGSDDKTLRKLEVNLGIEPARASDRGGDLGFVLELSDLNEAQTIEPPANVRPIDELLAGLGSLLGSSGLGGSGSGSGSGGAEGLDEYQRCITEAGSDVSKAQKCADLLTQ
ncbi:hypothetical protein [Conexibacter woesei]|uniref:Lipoprotein n=1 Tax=Conexibacter woesei (strain DSM 14684 / CCUG 47730 / CIP 108061 / JCM 11494 / NBRC 100937 / ID131577) TaxID=469383 RepID=D3F105_CONWI|nr:hypothetical protein [Conexibacter woesei]ADB50081.1 hypothetical protein Cwoe_1654 [Conexibacter woesei DSM 14684]